MGRFPGITKMISGVICSGSTAVLITEWYVFIILDSGNTKSILAGSVKQRKKKYSEESTNPPSSKILSIVEHLIFTFKLLFSFQSSLPHERHN